MSKKNKYYVLTFPYEGIQEIVRNCVGLFEDQRSNLAGDKIVVKLPKGFDNDVPDLKKYKEYNYVEILKLMDSPEWCQQI